MTFQSALKEFFDTGDPIIRTWPLLDSYWMPFALSSLYVFFIKRVGPALMENRKPFDLRIFMIVYNFSIVLVYTACLSVLCFYFLTTDAYKYLCSYTPLVEDTYLYTCTVAGWYIYILKYVEYGDTVFFILRKKFHLITNLHVIHHAALPVICWIILRTERSGFQFIPGGINSFIHIIMYTYYGLAAMGPQVQKKLWWKEYLTLLQMMQFIIILMFMFVVVPVSGCKTSKHGVYINIFFASVFLALFYNFYKKTYKSRKNGVDHQATNGTNGVAHQATNGTNGVHKSNGECLKKD